MKTYALKQHTYSFCLVVAAASILSFASHTFSGEGSDNQSTSFKLGHLAAPEVSGVAYRCGKHQGVTDAQGRFECGDEDRVAFYINGESLGSTDVQRTVTPVDLVKPLDRRYHVVTEIAHRRDGARKVLERLIQVDADRTIDNGIQIGHTDSDSQYASRIWNPVSRIQTPLNFEVAVVKDATAGAKIPEGDGYLAGLYNFRYMANAVWMTDEAVKHLQ